jgi:chaperonin GroES
MIPAKLDESQEIEEEEQEPGLSGVELLASYFAKIQNQDKIDYAPLHNVAGFIDDTTLGLVGRQVVEGHEADWDSMQEWRDGVEFGKDIAKQETEAKSDPWDGAANFKSPVLMNAALRFSDPASSQILRSRDLAKTDFNGKDADDQKAERGERVSEYINYQLNEEMPEWREEHEKLIYDLPYSGSVFKKTFFDAEKGRNVSDLICYPNFSVNQETKSLSRLPRFTEIMEFRNNEVIEKQNQGIWLDVELTEDGEGENEAENDKVREFVEQQGSYDLDGDGYEEPYTFVVQTNTRKVVRIIPRFDPENVIVRTKTTATTLAKAMEGGISDDMEVVRIKANCNITKYGFLHDPQGGFLDVGYSHLLGALTGAINTTTNQLLDSGTLANLSGGYLAKNFRRKMGDAKFRPGYWMQTGLSAQDLQSGMLPHQNKEPSMVLYQLNQDLKGNAQELSASADLGSALGPQTAPTTALAIVDEQLQKTGAIMLRIYRAMASEFNKLYKLNAKFTDPVEYQTVLDDPEADFRADFDQKGMDIIPVANPEISSKIQRIQMASAEMSQLEMVSIAGGDIRPIVKNFYEAIGSQNVDEIFPDETPEQMLQRIFSENPELVELVMEEKERLDLIAAAQADAFEREQQRQDIKLAADLDKTAAETENKQADTIKKLEEAETEQTKNQIDMYTGAQNIDRGALDLERQAQELTNDDNERRLPAVETPTSDQGGQS